MTHTLLRDIYSGKKELYGSKGDTVTIISVHGDVLIVENKKGRFIVRKEQLKKI